MFNKQLKLVYNLMYVKHSEDTIDTREDSKNRNTCFYVIKFVTVILVTSTRVHLCLSYLLLPTTNPKRRHMLILKF